MSYDMRSTDGGSDDFWILLLGGLIPIFLLGLVALVKFCGW